MKKWILGVMAVCMAVSLAACTPTTEKQRKQAAAATEGQKPTSPQTTGGASDKVPDPDVMPVAIISIYHKGNGDGLEQSMDSLDTEELDAQLLVSKMMEYNIFTDGTMVLSFSIEGEGENSMGTLDLNQAEKGEEVSDAQFLVEIGNTFIENFELDKLKVTVNGEQLPGAEELSYENDYEMVE
jgi:hypothetical protein